MPGGRGLRTNSLDRSSGAIGLRQSQFPRFDRDHWIPYFIQVQIFADLFSTADISNIALMRSFSTGIANGLHGSYFAYFSLEFVCSCFQGKWTEDRRSSVSEFDGHSRSFSFYQLCPCGIRDDASSGNRSPFFNQHSTRIRAIREESYALLCRYHRLGHHRQSWQGRTFHKGE